MSAEAELLKDSQATALMLGAPKLSSNNKVNGIKGRNPTHTSTDAEADKKQMCLGAETNDKYKEFKRHW